VLVFPYILSAVFLTVTFKGLGIVKLVFPEPQLRQFIFKDGLVTFTFLIDPSSTAIVV
jgi:hypothetical protein